jgi:hypothetical protein
VTNDKKMIAVGLIIFLIAATYPFWSAYLSGAKASRPVLEKPVGQTKCVEDTAFMRQNHMQMLNEWRTMSVRNGVTYYTSKSDNARHEMSLTKTCLKCHEKRDRFCDRCHNYANVAPTCWNCHNGPKGTN